MAVSVLIMKKAIPFLLIFCLLFPLCACTVSSAAYKTYGKYEITENQYKYWTAYYKARFFSSVTQYGYVVSDGYNEAIWDEKGEDGKTLGEQVREYVDKMINEMLVGSALYDGSELYNDKENRELLKQTVDELVQKDLTNAGSRGELNAILGKYGMNIDVLRRVYEFETRAMSVSDKLFGEGGEYAVTDEEREDYYQKNYSRVKHILIKNEEKYVLDEKGDPVMDVYTGRYKTEPLTDEEKAEKRKTAEEAYEKAKSGGDFEKLSEEYNEDGGMTAYTDGYFISDDTLLDENYVKTAVGLEVGEAALVETLYGLMVIKKYALEPGLWADEKNAVFFSSMDGNIRENKKAEYYEKYTAEIKTSPDIKPEEIFKNTEPLDSRLLPSS